MIFNRTEAHRYGIYLKVVGSLSGSCSLSLSLSISFRIHFEILLFVILLLLFFNGFACLYISDLVLFYAIMRSSNHNHKSEWLKTDGQLNPMTLLAENGSYMVMGFCDLWFYWK